MKKTTYEKKVNAGKVPPLTGLDAAFIEDLVSTVIKNNTYTQEELISLEGVWDELEFLYKDDSDTLNALKIVLELI